MTPIREYFSSTQVLHRLRSMSELVPRSLRGNPAERGQPHRRIRVSSVSIDRGRHDGLHTAHRQGLRWPAKNSALLTGELKIYSCCTSSLLTREMGSYPPA